MSALITQRNNPSVRIIKGIENKVKIGLTKILTNPRAKATQSVVENESTQTPGRNCAQSQTPKDTASHFKINFIMRIRMQIFPEFL